MVQYVELRVSLFHIHAIHRDMQKFRAKGPYSELTFRGKFRSTFRGASKASIHSLIFKIILKFRSTNEMTLYDYFIG